MRYYAYLIGWVWMIFAIIWLLSHDPTAGGIALVCSQVWFATDWLSGRQSDG